MVAGFKSLLLFLVVNLALLKLRPYLIKILTLNGPMMRMYHEPKVSLIPRPQGDS